jgi:DNA repair protein RecO (recombination protein O)
MPPFVTEAVILRSGDFGERDRLITFYGDRLGKMRGVAKGAKRSTKRFGANLDLLAYVRVHGFERRNVDLVRIDGVDLLEYHSRVRSDLRTFARGCYLAEWVDGCTAACHPLPGLLPLLLWVLASLEGGRGGEEILRIFEVKTLDLAGYRPQLNSCVACGRGMRGETKVLIHVARGGVLCESCAAGVNGGLRVSLGTIRILEDARRSELGKLHRIAFSSMSLEESRTVLRAFYEFHVGHPLRSTSFLNTLERQGRPKG